MKEQIKTKHHETNSYSMENMEKPEISEEESGVWEITKEGVAKAWSATKEGAVKAWDKTKEVTEDLTGLGHDHDDETAFFEEENITDEYGHHIHHARGLTEDDGQFASFSETDEGIPHHLHNSPDNVCSHNSSSSLRR